AFERVSLSGSPAWLYCWHHPPTLPTPGRVMHWNRNSLIAFVLLAVGWLAGMHFVAGQNDGAVAVKGWKRGAGWGWIWGKEDEVGSLNATNDSSRAAALRLAQQGKVYDLGIA